MKGGGWDERSDSERDRKGGAPFMLILSPKWASVRMSAQSEIVSEVPPPPAAESSCFSRRVTAGYVSLAEMENLLEERRDLLPMTSTMPVNMIDNLPYLTA